MMDGWAWDIDDDLCGMKQMGNCELRAEYKAMSMAFEFLEGILIDQVPVGFQGTGL